MVDTTSLTLLRLRSEDGRTCNPGEVKGGLPRGEGLLHLQELLEAIEP